MDKLSAIYEYLDRLRGAGMKMKRIAQAAGLTPAMLSSLYSSVLPRYTEALTAGVGQAEALEKALKSVNNISRRKLDECAESLYACVKSLAESMGSMGGGDVMAAIAQAARRDVTWGNAYAGLYTAYSADADADALRAEPCLISPAEGDATEQKAYRVTKEGDVVAGVCLFSPYQTGFILFSGQRGGQTALSSLCLRLPVMVFPHFIKGIHVSHDYNRNPTARRMLLVRDGDAIPLSELARLQAQTIGKQQLKGELQTFYDYTCGECDMIKSAIFSSPERNPADLLREKEMLDKKAGDLR